MPLDALQSDFSAAMFDSTCDGALLRALHAPDANTPGRIALYRGNLLAAWQKALSNVFPVTRALVGDEFFDALARVYGHACPSTSGDLNCFGDRFASFVADFEHTRSLPYLPDVAKLEWAVHCAHYAADAEPLSRGRIAGLKPQDLLASRFTLHQACTWVTSEFPIASIWLAHQPEATVALPDSLEHSETALVARPRWRAEVVVACKGEIAALNELRSGEPMETAIQAALDVEPAFDFVKALLRWLELALLSEVPEVPLPSGKQLS
jgi:uncharacterized protein